MNRPELPPILNTKEYKSLVESINKKMKNRGNIVTNPIVLCTIIDTMVYIIGLLMVIVVCAFVYYLGLYNPHP